MASMKPAKPTFKKSATTKLGPGECIPDVAFQRIEDAPRPKILKQHRNYDHHPCPQRGKSSFRYQVFPRTLHDIGDLESGRPHEIHLTYSHSGKVVRITLIKSIAAGPA